MFTGIIEEVGTIKEIKRGSLSSMLTIQGKKVLEDTKLGDSISVNGVCLTVTEMGNEFFRADVMAETVRRSSLKESKVGTSVNLERAMSANGRFGGHFVSGHIEGTGNIKRIEKEENGIWYTIHTDPKILRYIVEKGSIAIDGISLTVAYVEEKSFRVSVIPHTQEETNLIFKKIEDLVNLEPDILAKYAEKWVKPERENRLTQAFLLENGF